jgi:sucrose synthase
VHTLKEIIEEKEIHDFRKFLYQLCQGENKYLLNNDIMLAFEDYRRNHDNGTILNEESSLYRFLNQTPEVIIQDGSMMILHRHQTARYKVYKLNTHSEEIEELSIPELLHFRDRFINPNKHNRNGKVHIDFMPFYDYGPKMKDTKRIGKGIAYLNKHLSSSLFQHPEKWNRKLIEFLKIHSFDSQPLLINGAYFSDYQQLILSLENMITRLERLRNDTLHTEVIPLLKRNGFEPGWGNTAGRIKETMQLLLELFQEPDSHNLEEFISRIPMISKIAIISPHGWFGQENVLGKPDTGGQVVYILDQVYALEKILTERIEKYGLDIQPQIVIVTRLIPQNEVTTSNIRLEKIHYTQNCHILRVPFKNEDGSIVPQWISRFKVWPYLDRFAEDCYTELQGEFNGKPDLIIGNYSDGNLVATLLSEKFEVTQCNIAHALEKTKYLFSDLYWQNFEKDYHFSLQFVADLISMNMADFIITSTQQEITGSAEGIGQYESYQFFSMPDLIHVENGINLFHPKFNVIPPGVDEKIYFPYYQTEKRLENKVNHLEQLLFYEQNESVRGYFDDPAKPPIFTMARLDRIKNISGLVESFGRCPELQEKANLIVIAGKNDLAKSSDAEEKEGITQMYELIEKFQLQGKIRWLEAFSREDGAESYRIIADRKGVFVQPARFEGFGLTVLEAMLSGLPTFATQFGGPSEIIEDGKSGLLINPTMPELISAPLLEFFKKTEKDPSHWQNISREAIRRVQEHFTWRLYSEKLLNLTALYGFWRYSEANDGKREMALYCHLLFQLLFKPRANEVIV